MRLTSRPFCFRTDRKITLLVFFGLLFNWLALPLGTAEVIEAALAQQELALSSQFYCSTSSGSEDTSQTDHAHCPKCECCHHLGQLYFAPKISLGIPERTPILIEVPLGVQAFAQPSPAPLSRGPPALV